MAVGFTAEEWKTMSTQQLARRCRDMSAEAEALAVDARPEKKEAYLRVATEWLKLATEIEHYANDERDSRRKG
jgi:hypothetical protein